MSVLYNKFKSSTPCLLESVDENEDGGERSQRSSVHQLLALARRRGSTPLGNTNKDNNNYTWTAPSWHLRSHPDTLKKSYDNLCASLKITPERLQMDDSHLDMAKIEKEYRRMQSDLEKLQSTLLDFSDQTAYIQEENKRPKIKSEEKEKKVYFESQCENECEDNVDEEEEEEEEDEDEKEREYEPVGLDTDLEVASITCPHPESPMIGHHTGEYGESSHRHTSKIPTPVKFLKKGRSQSVIQSSLMQSEQNLHELSRAHYDQEYSEVHTDSGLRSGRQTSVDLGRYATPLTTYRMAMLKKNKQNS